MTPSPQPPTTCAEALAQLGLQGAKGLTAAQREQLDRDGYVVFERAMPLELARRIARRVDEIAEEEGEDAGKDFQTEEGATRLGSLVEKDPIFDACFLDPHALSAIDYLCGGEFGLSSMTCRAAQPGAGGQELHLDYMEEDGEGGWRPGEGRAANVLWALDEFTPDNGPTRIIPGSHRFGQQPQDVMNPHDPHPDEIYLIVPPGSLAVIDGATWHGGTRNSTEKPRRLVSAFFTPRNHYQYPEVREVRASTRARFSDAAAFILDHPVRDG